MMRFISSYLLFILICFLSSCSSEPVAVEKPPPVVTAMLVKAIDIPAIFTFVGRSQSSHNVEIRSRVEGYLQEISYIEGQLVEEGTLLFKLDPKPFEASLRNVEAQLAKQEAILARAQMEVTRLTPLYEKKATSKKSLDDAESGLLTSKANVEAAKAEVEQAKLNLGYTTIYSPIKGLTGSSLYRVGALITPGAGSLMTTVSQINPIWINFSVSEGQTLQYEKQVKEKILLTPKTENYTVQVLLGDGSTYPYEGHVDFASPTIETNTGTISLRGVVPNPNGTIKPGQFVRVRLLGAIRPNSILVPQQAISQGGQGFYVYILNENDIVQMRPVEVAQWFKDFWIVTSGLEEDDKIVVDGINKVIIGSAVKISSYIELPNDFIQEIEKQKNK